MDFTQVIMVHIAWKIRLQKYVEGDRSELLDPGAIGLDNGCALGQWIYGEGLRYQELEEYALLKDEHATFHRLAAQIVRTRDAGRIDEARHLLDGKYSQTSEHVKRMIVRMAIRTK